MRKRRAIICAGVFLAVAITILYAIRSRSVVFRFRDIGSVNAEPVLIVTNPFRDKRPEAAAITVLDALRKKDFDLAFSTIQMAADEKSSIIEREWKYPLKGWTLCNRTDGPGTVRLYYLTTRSNSHGVKGPMWVTVRHTEAGWRAEKLEVWY